MERDGDLRYASHQGRSCSARPAGVQNEPAAGQQQGVGHGVGLQEEEGAEVGFQGRVGVVERLPARREEDAGPWEWPEGWNAWSEGEAAGGSVQTIWRQPGNLRLTFPLRLAPRCV